MSAWLICNFRFPGLHRDILDVLVLFRTKNCGGIRDRKQLKLQPKAGRSDIVEPEPIPKIRKIVSLASVLHEASLRLYTNL